MSLPATFVRGFHDEEAVKKMEYIPYGNTGLMVSKLGFGGAPLSGSFGAVSEEEGIAMLQTAIKSGINYIDTAPYYGQGKSEEIIGKALKGIPRQAYYIATKVGRYEKSGPNQFNYTAEKTRESVKKSLALLGLSSVDLIQIHDIEFAQNLDVVVNECLPTLEKMKEEGVTKFIGVSAYPVSVLKECITKAGKGRFNTVLVYSRYSLLDDTLLDYMPFFNDYGMTVICASVHALGLLGNVGVPPWHPAFDDTKSVCEEARQICKKNGVELGKLAMHYSGLLKGVGPFLVGMTCMAQLEMNIDAMLHGLDTKEKAVLVELQEK